MTAERSFGGSVNIDIGLRELKALYDLGRIALTKARTRIATPTRVEKLADDVFTSRLKFGSVVTVKGKLTRYSTTYRPATHSTHVITRSSDAELNNWVIDRSTGQRKRKININVEFSPFQFPVQTHPAFEDEVGTWHIAFLYPAGFDGFILDTDKNDENQRQGDGLLIGHDQQPIPVLLSNSAFEEYSECEVVLTGVVLSLPENVVSAIGSNLCSIRETFFYHFLRPFSLHAGFCLDCRDQHNSDVLDCGKLESLPATVYVEGHFEEIDSNAYDGQFTKSIPKGLEHVWTFPTSHGKVFYPSQDPYISVVRDGHNRFGFYTRINLVDPRDYESKLRHMRDFYTSFWKNATNNIRREHSVDVKFKPDFMFDYSRQKVFHPKGVLTSAEVDSALRHRPELKETTAWVRKG